MMSYIKYKMMKVIKCKHGMNLKFLLRHSLHTGKCFFRINAYLRIVKFFMHSPEATNLSPEIIFAFCVFPLLLTVNC